MRCVDRRVRLQPDISRDPAGPVARQPHPSSAPKALVTVPGASGRRGGPASRHPHVVVSKIYAAVLDNESPMTSRSFAFVGCVLLLATHSALARDVVVKVDGHNVHMTIVDPPRRNPAFSTVVFESGLGDAGTTGWRRVLPLLPNGRSCCHL